MYSYSYIVISRISCGTICIPYFTVKRNLYAYSVVLVCYTKFYNTQRVYLWFLVYTSALLWYIDKAQSLRKVTLGYSSLFSSGLKGSLASLIYFFIFSLPTVSGNPGVTVHLYTTPSSMYRGPFKFWVKDIAI